MKSLRFVAGLIKAVLPIVIVAGCATKAPVKKEEYVFFPPPPDAPKIQFLTSISGESDLQGASKLQQIVVGSDRIVRPIWKPYGLTTTKGKIFICDTMPKNVTVVDLNKRKVSYVRPEGRGTLKMPINVAVDKDGTRYVTDTGRGQVVVFDGDNNFVAEVGKPGEMKPCGLVLDDKRFYVTDLSNHCVRVYSKANRELLFQIPKDPNDHKSKLFSPTNITLDKQGNLYISDTGAFAVKVFDRDGKFLRVTGDVGLKPGRFALPKGIAVDRDDRLYVVDAATGVVQLFDNEGKLLMYFGEPQSSGKAGLYLPAGISLDYENVGNFQKYAAPGYKIEFLIYVTNQAGNRKLSVFGFMRKT